MEVHPVYVLKADNRDQSGLRNPLSLFDPETMGPIIERYGIPRRRLTGLMRPVVPPSGSRRSAATSPLSRRQAAALAPAADRGQDRATATNNQDISSLVGRSTSAESRAWPRTTPTPTVTGGLNRANQGILEFVPRCSRRRSDAASVADGDPGGQLHRYREHRRHTFRWRHSRASNEAEWQS